MKKLNRTTQTKLTRTMAGLSLIELLIAMVLGLTLAAGVIQIYVGSTTTERDQEARLRMQENGRFALNFLANEMRMAGYLGCFGSMEGLTANDNLNQPAKAIEHYEKALELSTQSRYVRRRKGITENLAQLYFERGDSKKAYEYLEISKALGDTMYNEKNLEITSELEAKYNRKQKEARG